MSKPWKNFLGALALVASGLCTGNSVLVGDFAPLTLVVDGLAIGFLAFGLWQLVVLRKPWW